VGFPGVPFWNTSLVGSGGGGGDISGSAGSGNIGLPKLEGQIYVPVGGWVIEVVEDPVAAATITIPTGLYYPNSAYDGNLAFLADVAALLNASALAGTYTLVADDDYTQSTGRVTIAASGVTSFTIGWTSTGPRDALGFTGTIYGAASYTSPNSTPHIWLPDVFRAPAMAPDGSTGLPVTSTTITRSPAFTSKAVSGSSGTVDRLEFQKLTGRKTWSDYETVVNESYKTFWNASIGLGRRVRYHPSRATDATYVGYRALACNDMRCAAHVQTWTSSAQSLWNQGPIDVINE
jgi:hypothetical protein